MQAAVTASMPGLSGFYVQEEDAEADGDPATSEGVFVFSAIPAGVAVGDVVRISATVSEFETSGGLSSLTELTGATIAECAVDPVAVTPTDLSFPVAAADDIESYEGMLTTLPQELVISEYFNFGRFNEIVLALPMPGLDRLFTPTAVVEPGPDAIALAAEYAKRRITIDDGRSTQNPDPAIHSGNGNVFDLSNRFRGGDTITGITGVDRRHVRPVPGPADAVRHLLGRQCQAAGTGGRGRERDRCSHEPAQLLPHARPRA